MQKLCQYPCSYYPDSRTQYTIFSNNKPINIEKRTYLLLTISLTLVETHVNQLLQHLVNIGKKIRTGAPFSGSNGMNTELHLTSKKCRTQHNTKKKQTDSSKSSNKKLLKTNVTSLECDNMTDYIFGLTASIEKNYHIEFDEIDIIFDGNSIHCTEVKHSTSDDSENLKYQGVCINHATVTTRVQ